ncbi:hypothetical protein QTO34_019339 [Cnephaeus nilssonii]|uniref:Di19 zinc-binding domain-containing protein n=1 Tax=Cnephaeus nilssonii TaxID=3371016 RepID=A0AA40HXG5_CNENI|nr:hypothetical protein QTO34_019339 [Eptesicus nilssonii]
MPPTPPRGSPRVEFDLYYGGEAFSAEQPQPFICPCCGKMACTETSLHKYVASEHAETSTEVICPVCAALPVGGPDPATNDCAAHLTLEHRAPRDLDELSGPNMHFTSSSTGGLSTQSSCFPSNRDATEPIAELLSQWSGNCQQLETTRDTSCALTQAHHYNHTIIPTTNTADTERQHTIQNSQCLLTRWQPVQELLPSTFLGEESSSSDEDSTPAADQPCLSDQAPSTDPETLTGIETDQSEPNLGQLLCIQMPFSCSPEEVTGVGRRQALRTWSRQRSRACCRGDRKDTRPCAHGASGGAGHGVFPMVAAVIGKTPGPAHTEPVEEQGMASSRWLLR